MGLQLIQQLLVEELLALQCTLLCRQGLVFERFEFGCDVALAVLERLAALVVRRHHVLIAVRDLDVEAMHLVELHAQIGDVGEQLFLGFEFKQEFIAVFLNAAQLVQQVLP